MNHGPTRRTVLAGGAALAAGSLVGLVPSMAGPARRLLVADRPLRAASLLRAAEPISGRVPLLLVAEGPAPLSPGIRLLSPRTLLHLPTERLAALLSDAPTLHVAAPLGGSQRPSDRNLGATTLDLLRSCDAISVCALALPEAESRDTLRAEALAAGWVLQTI